MKKASGDVIILHMCAKNNDHIVMLPEIMECSRHIFLSFWDIFCSLTPLTTCKIKILKKMKKKNKTPGNIILLHMCTINGDHMTLFYLELFCSWYIGLGSQT